MFHPNVNFDTGEICLDILKREWTPAWSLEAACRAIIALLGASCLVGRIRGYEQAKTDSTR
jgi:ubiquitin-protein ligase